MQIRILIDSTDENLSVNLDQASDDKTVVKINDIPVKALDLLEALKVLGHELPHVPAVIFKEKQPDPYPIKTWSQNAGGGTKVQF